jgi:hypothetical protein
MRPDFGRFVRHHVQSNVPRSQLARGRSGHPVRRSDPTNIHSAEVTLENSWLVFVATILAHPSFAPHHCIATRLSGPQLSPQLTQQLLDQVSRALAMSRTRLAAQAQAIWRGAPRSIASRRWVSSGPTMGTGAGPSSSGVTSNGVRYTALAALGAVVSATELPALYHSLAPLIHHSSSPHLFSISPASECPCPTSDIFAVVSTSRYSPSPRGHCGCDASGGCLGCLGSLAAKTPADPHPRQSTPPPTSAPPCSRTSVSARSKTTCPGRSSQAAKS